MLNRFTAAHLKGLKGKSVEKFESNTVIDMQSTEPAQKKEYRIVLQGCRIPFI